MRSLLFAVTLAAAQSADLPGPGIPESLALERAAGVAGLRYELTFSVPASVREPVHGRAVVRFTLDVPRRVVLDFAQPRERVRSVTIGGRPVAFSAHENHLLIPSSATSAGPNEISVEFVAGDEPLNRNDEFLYTLIVPARAHLAFPAFEQPDMKARYTLTLEVPADWQAVSNAAEVDRVPAGEGRQRVSG